MNSEPVALSAPAKVTLSLRVRSVRADGFHELEALTVSTTAPRDTLTLEESASTEVTVSGPFAAGVPTDASNLVVRALDLVGRSAAVTLHKGIPAGAGLGGGSSDAAAILRVFGGSPGDAAKLGSDVTFCLHGGPAWMRGRGERVDPIDGLPPLDLVIAAPEFGCSTPAVYRAWDDLGGPESARAVDAPGGNPGPFVNDLEPAAERVEPRLRDFRHALEAITGRSALLCGSGSAYATWFANGADAGSAAAAVRAALGDERVWVGRTIVDAARARIER